MGHPNGVHTGGVRPQLIAYADALNCWVFLHLRAHPHTWFSVFELGRVIADQYVGGAKAPSMAGPRPGRSNVLYKILDGMVAAGEAVVRSRAGTTVATAREWRWAGTGPAQAEIPCALCGDPLHKVANTRLDEFEYVDGAGNSIGTDSDLRGLGPDGPDGRLAWLASEIERGHKQRGSGKRAEHTWLYWARSKEYSALLVRLASGSWHVHYVRHTDQPVWDGPPVPEHCGWPMWLRPSGWWCRQEQVLVEGANTMEEK